MILFISAAFPVFIFLYMIYRKDHEKEPLGLLLIAFGGGCISPVVSLLLSEGFMTLSGLFPGSLLTSFHESFLQAAVPEEIAKFFFLYLIVWKSREFNHHYDGIVYAVFVSLGFALVENILYVFEGGIGTAIGRAILAIPGHGLDGVLMGYYFSLARFHDGKKRKEFLFKSLAVPILFHGGYDFFLFYMDKSLNNNFLLFGLFIAFLWLVIKLWKKGIYKINKHLKRDGKLLKSAI